MKKLSLATGVLGASLAPMAAFAGTTAPSIDAIVSDSFDVGPVMLALGTVIGGVLLVRVAIAGFRWVRGAIN